MIDIQKNIPLPPRTSARKRNKYPWEQLRIGDSLLLTVSSMNAARSMAHKVSKRLGYEFEIREWSGGFRVWRVKEALKASKEN
jgi:hypothetical protein